MTDMMMDLKALLEKAPDADLPLARRSASPPSS
jgi:hypothetical protein